ncbi:hypothetical protein DM02DRAFT_627080 [Periconia macrospinosa]|uniref:Ankyrin n=1 Tax=Periconia macrospinosa TaxID=97972 RepID=A0A2V1DV15_9PLEO|nr:hypothetical protein DM02DRAFT_627080 [Periconia macrospinosa]
MYCILRNLILPSLPLAVARGDYEPPHTAVRPRSERTRQDSSKGETEHHTSSQSTDSSSSESSTSGDETLDITQPPKIHRKRFELAAYLGDMPVLRQCLLQLKPGRNTSSFEFSCISAASSGQVEALKFLMTEGHKFIDLHHFANHDVTDLLLSTIKGGHVEAFLFVLSWYTKNCNSERLKDEPKWGKDEREWHKVLEASAKVKETRFMASLLETVPVCSQLDAMAFTLLVAIGHDELGVAAVLWNHLFQSSPLLVQPDYPYPIQRVLFLQPYVNTSSDDDRKRAEFQLRGLVYLSHQQSNCEIRPKLLEVIDQAGFDDAFFCTLLVDACKQGLASSLDLLKFTQERRVIRSEIVNEIISVVMFWGHTEILRFIFEELLAESSLDELATSLNDSLIVAAFQGRYKIIKYVLGSGGLMDLVSDVELLQNRILAAAAEGGHLRIVRLCLTERADANTPVPPMPYVGTPDDVR